MFGGYFFDGSEIRSIVREALALGISNFSVSGVFSTCRNDQEKQVAD